MLQKVINASEGYIPVTGGLIWYKIVNPGKNALPLLTLHGGPGFPHDYLEPLEGLADERPIIFYDQLGCGKSQQPDNIHLWQSKRFVEELDQVREALHLEEVHLFGHSWGSMLAIDYTLTKPGGIVSLILASPALCIPQWLKDTKGYRRRLPLEVQHVLDEHEANGTTDSGEYQAATMEFYKRHLCRLNPWPEPLQRASAGEGTKVYNTMWGPAEFFMTGNLSNYDCTARLGEIGIPTLFTCGRYDEATPEATAWYQRLLPESKMAVFEQSAHMSHLEETERYLLILRNFLREKQRNK